MSAICDTHKKKGALNYYLTQCSLKIGELVTRCGRESQHPAVSWDPGPLVEQPWRTGKNADGHKSGEVNMLQFCSASNSLSQTTLSNKVRGIFFKELCRHYYCVVVMILHTYVDVYVLCVCIVGHGCGYKTEKLVIMLNTKLVCSYY